MSACAPVAPLVFSMGISQGIDCIEINNSAIINSDQWIEGKKNMSCGSGPFHWYHPIFDIFGWLLGVPSS